MKCSAFSSDPLYIIESNEAATLKTDGLTRVSACRTKISPALLARFNGGLIICTADWEVKPFMYQVLTPVMAAWSVGRAFVDIPNGAWRPVRVARGHQAMKTNPQIDLWGTRTPAIVVPNAPVAQRIEHWPPEPGAWVRVPPGVPPPSLRRIIKGRQALRRCQHLGSIPEVKNLFMTSKTWRALGPSKNAPRNQGAILCLRRRTRNIPG